MGRRPYPRPPQLSLLQLLQLLMLLLPVYLAVPLEIFKECDVPEKQCGHPMGKDATSNLGYELDMRIEKAWIITISRMGADDKCEINIGANAKFFCGAGGKDEQKLAGGTVNVKNEDSEKDSVDLTIKREKYSLSTNGDDPVYDVLKLYAQAETIVSLKDDASESIGAEGINLSGCDSDPHTFVGTGEDAPKDATIPNKYDCSSSTYKTIFLNQESTDVVAVYCSKRGWRKEDHTFIKENKKEKVFCSTPPTPLAIFEKCGTELCYIYDNMDDPKKLIITGEKPNMKDPLGVELETSVAGKWILTMAWKGMESDCKFSIGDAEFKCNKNKGDKQDVFGATFEKIAKGESGDIKYEKYEITPKEASDPIIDALNLYEKEKHKLKLQNLESDAIEFFKGCTTGTSELKGSKEPTKEVNKYTCKGRLNQVYLDAKNLFETATGDTIIYCTAGGWRDEAGKVLERFRAPIQNVRCYSNDPPNPLPVFNDCSDTKLCFNYISTSSKLDKINDRPKNQGDNPLGVELDTSNKEEWVVTLVWSGLETECQFAIGNANFECNKDLDDSKSYQEAIFTKKKSGSDRDIKYEKYTITPNVAGEPIVDALKLYEKATHKLKLSGSGKSWESDEITLFEGCETTATDSPIPLAKAAVKTVNKYSCSGRFNHVFIYDKGYFKDKAASEATAVYCSKKGWREDTVARTVLQQYNKENVYCYTNEPYNRLPIFEKCDGKIKCFIFVENDETKLVSTKSIPTPAPDAQNGDIKLGVQIDMSNDNQWVLTMAWKEIKPDCKFTIGTVTFDCDKNMDDTQPKGGAIITKTKEGQDLAVQYEEYTITAKNAADDPVVDALELYKKLEHKLELSGGGKTRTLEGIKFFEACTVEKAKAPFSQKAQEATTDQHNRFECKSHALLNVIFLNSERQKDVSTVYCSQRGWRKDDGSFLTKFASEQPYEQPYCYSVNNKSDIPMFEDCVKHVCYVFNHVQTKYISPTPSELVKIEKSSDAKYPLGIDLDNTNDEKWTLIISYEDFEDFEFQIDELPAISIKGKKIGADIPLHGFANVNVKYVQEGQDGTVFFHKFTFQPSTAGDSLIDNLKLYEKATYPVRLMFKDSKPFEHGKKGEIEFFKEGCSGGYYVFEFGKPTVPTREHNILSCPSSTAEHTAIFINDKMLDGRVLYCSKKGWRDSNRKVVKAFEKGEVAFCSTLCQDAAMTIVETFDVTGKKVEPKSDPDKFDYKCLEGKASIRVDGIFYDNLKCETNKWSGDGVAIKLEYSKAKGFKSYQFEAKCFGAFMFLSGNCDKPGQKQTGCQQPKLVADEKLECDDGFALTYKDKIYKSLKMVKGEWRDQDNKYVGNADEKELPQCLSKCKPEHVKRLKGDLSDDVDYTWDELTNTGTLKCKDETNILIADFGGSEKSYFSDWTCDAKTEWKIKTGTANKDLKSINNPAEFVVNARCFKACDNTKVAKGCDQKETECQEFKYEGHELSCGDNEVMFIFDPITNSPVEQQKTPLVCSALGWNVKGETPVKYNHKVNKEVEITVQCVEKCALRFRTDDVDTKYEKNVMTCAGTKMISYAYSPAALAKETLHDLKCDNKEGWTANGETVIDFRTSYKFTAKCVDSCTDAWLVANCAPGVRAECEKANLASDRITCAKKGHVLHYRAPSDLATTAALEYEAISCSKTAFENEVKDGKNKISLTRVDPDTKIHVECISKCDKQFVGLDLDIAEGRVPTLDPGKPNSLAKSDIELKCSDPLHYTTLIINGNPLYTKDKFVCNPTQGWSASDLSEGKVLNEKHLDSSKVGCFDVCKNRFTVPTGKDGGDYKMPTYDDGIIKTISCGNEHTMSFKDNDLVRETLECKDKGYFRQSNDVVIHSFDHNDATSKFKMHCFSNCKKDLVTIVSSHHVRQEDNLLKCLPDELLQIETNSNTVTRRVFSDATCTPAKGWLGKVAKADNLDIEDGMFVDFATNVRLQVSCRKVCSNRTNMVDDCQDAELKMNSCQETLFAQDGTEGSTHKLKCTSEHYRLFMKYGEAEEYEETGPSKCTRTGWTNEKSEIIKTMNFMDPDVAIEQNVHYKCKHKCHRDFIKDSCVTEGKNPDEVTCSKVNYDPVSRKMHCNHPSEVLVFEYAANRNDQTASKESFSSTVVNASCSDQGWKMEDGTGTEIFAMTADNFHISARCEQMCHPALLTQSDSTKKGTLKYELGGILTCEQIDEKLVFADNDWHTDLKCSAKGWIDATFDSMNKATDSQAKPIGEILFEPNKDRTFKAECIPSACINNQAERCKQAAQEGRAHECKQPDFETRKYYVECNEPMQIINKADMTLTYGLLRCVANPTGDGDVWMNWNEQQHKAIVPPVQDAGSLETFTCVADKCAKCKADKKLEFECGGSDPNCISVHFHAGSASFCSKYQCKSPGYRIGSAPSNYKYYQNIQTIEEKTEITCMDPGPPAAFFAPDHKSTVNTGIACVQRIPCVDFAPLNTTCAGLAVSCDEEGLKQNLTAASKINAPAIQCTEDKQLYYSETGSAPWTKFESLQCEDNGQWIALDKRNGEATKTKIGGEDKEKKNKDEAKNTRVVCTESDPAGPKPTTTTPKPGICSFCALPPKKECDGCSTDAITTKEVNGTCTATTTNGHFVNEKKETVESLKCKDEKTGVYVWRDGKGNEVKSLAVVGENAIIAGANPGMIAGIVIGVLCIIGGVAGLVVFMHIRKKKEAVRLETLKSKGLETKNDSIIDQIEVDDPKTIRL